MAALVCAAIMTVRRSTRSPASIAVVGQLPSLVVVALITQYSMFLWFCVGLAITWARDADVIGRGKQQSEEALQDALGPVHRQRLVGKPPAQS